MADWNTPSLSTSYTGFLQALKDRDIDSATMFASGGTNTPIGAIRFDAGSQTSTFRKWDGSNWVDAAATLYMPNLRTSRLFIGDYIVTGADVSTGDTALELGAARTGSGNCYIDMHSTSGSDFEARIWRGGGANSDMNIFNSGSGNLNLWQLSAAPIAFGTANSERMRVSPTGNIGIGTYDPVTPLHVRSDTNSQPLKLESSAFETSINLTNNGSGGRTYLLGTGGNGGAMANGAIGIWDDTAGVRRWLIDSSGNMSVGKITPATKLHVDGDIRAEGSLSASGTLYISTSNAYGGGIVLSDDGDIVDLNTGYCSMRFSDGTQIFSANKSGSAVITLGSDGNITANGAIRAQGNQMVASRIDGRGSAGINFSTSAPSGGSDGDMWFQYS